MAVDKRFNDRRSRYTEKRPHDKRPEDERDRSRLIHCASFRRLQAKTQVLGVGETDFHRTRLTHSMEVAQIGGGIVYQLRANYESDSKIFEYLPEIPLIETIGFGHDIGHPPFGHGGEIALNFMMRDAGGFEGNGQSLRICSRLELHTEGHGLDLTRRALLGILKYPAPYSQLRAKKLPAVPDTLTKLDSTQWRPPKCYLDTENDVVSWILEPFSKADRDRLTVIKQPSTDTEHGETTNHALDTSILELADDIAYGVHDLEDGAVLDLIRRDHWKEATKKLDHDWAASFDFKPDRFADDVFEARRGVRSGRRKLAIGSLVNALVCSIQIFRLEFESPLLALNAQLIPPAEAWLKTLKKLTRESIIESRNIQTLEYRGRFVIRALFEAIESDWKRLLPISFRNDAEKGDVKRAVCDYVAGMTDAYASRIYERLFVPGEGSVFERI